MVINVRVLLKLQHSRVTYHVSPCDALVPATHALTSSTEWVNFTRFNEI